MDIVTNLISERKIPTLDELQMEALLHHLFTATRRDTRIQVAEVACRYDREHPRAMDVFLASALPLAERSARRRAAKIFVHPSDLQIELMYGGAVEAVIAVFHSKCVLKAEANAFRRYLLRSIALGAVRAYFRREENHGIQAAADLTAFASPKRLSRNDIEDGIIIGELLDRTVTFPQLRHPCAPPLNAFALSVRITLSRNMPSQHPATRTPGSGNGAEDQSSTRW